MSRPGLDILHLQSYAYNRIPKGSTMKKTLSDKVIWLELFLCLFAISAVSAAFWSGWHFYYGTVPRGPGNISRWWDIIIQPMWVMITFALIFLHDEYVSKFNLIVEHRTVSNNLINSLAWLALVSLIVGYFFGIYYGFCLFIPVLAVAVVEFFTSFFYRGSK